METRALFRRFPELADRLPWLPLARLPTPIEPLAVTGGHWIKRDDLTARPYGGNKVRKLEFLLAAARARNARRLITVGAAGSHHALATAIYGRQEGFDVSLILFPQPFTAHVRDVLLLDLAYGAELRYTRRMETVPAALLVAALRYRSHGAFIIPAGGSDATGTLGYVSAALELAEQIERGEADPPATIVVAAGTLGTAAGLALGCAIAGLPVTIQAVRITSRIVTNERVLAHLVRGAEQIMRRAGAPVNAAESALGRVTLIHDFIGRGYGRDTPASEAAAARFGEHGFDLDATYTAKAAAAFLALTREAKRPALFWHTLGAQRPPAPRPASEAELPKPFRDYVAGAR